MFLNIITDLINKIKKIIYGNYYEEGNEEDEENEEDVSENNRYYDYNIQTKNLKKYYKKINHNLYIRNNDYSHINFFIYERYLEKDLYEITNCDDPYLDKGNTNKIFMLYDEIFYTLQEGKYIQYKKEIFIM